MLKTRAGGIIGNVPDEGIDERLVMTVPEAGRKLGLSREAAYAAARRGDLPVIRIGHLWKVPVVQFNRLLNGAK